MPTFAPGAITNPNPTIPNEEARKRGAKNGKRGPQYHPFFEKLATGAWFAKLIPNELEARYWLYFMSGYITEDLWDGRKQIIRIPLDPIMWAAFKRAVEYKRGMPIQPVAAKVEATVGFTIVNNVKRPAAKAPPTEGANGSGNGKAED